MYSLLLKLAIYIQFLVKYFKNSFFLYIYSIMHYLFQALGTEQGSTIFIKCFPYYIAANCEAFILCYTGEYLMFKVK